MTGALTTDAVHYLEKVRKISIETAERHGIFAERTERGGNILVTPYYLDGEVVNHKRRLFSLADPEFKRFFMDDGGHLCLWNADILEDPLLQDPNCPLVITEGEIDGLTVDDCGHPQVVSVPNGAKEGGLGFLEQHMGRLKNVAKFVIAVDDDPAGRKLKESLLNALSLPRCHLVSYPDGCKDLNKVRQVHGPEAVLSAIRDARPVPYQGAYYAYEFGEFEGHKQYECGIQCLDSTARVFEGGLVVVTGTPGTGKSQFLQYLCYSLAKLHGLKCVIGSFENEPAEVIHSFERMFRGARPGTREIKAAARKWIGEHFFFVVTDAPESGPEGEEPEETDLPWLLDAASTFIIREGARVVAIDPWNELDHNRRRDETISEYIARALREMKRWARRNSVVLIVAAHPTKLEYDKQKKTFRVPTLYDIYGSSAWYDKCDIGIVCSRVSGASTMAVNVSKVRFKDTGRPAQVAIAWNDAMGCYESAELL